MMRIALSGFRMALLVVFAVGISGCGDVDGAWDDEPSSEFGTSTGAMKGEDSERCREQTNTIRQIQTHNETLHSDIRADIRQACAVVEEVAETVERDD